MTASGMFLPAVLIPTLGSLLLCKATIVTKEIDPEACETPLCQESARILLDSMDTSVDPCEDFYRYACGGWIDRHPIPDGQTSISVYSVLTEEIEQALAKDLKTAIKEEHPRPVHDAANLYLGCLDEESREVQGADPLKNVLNALGGWPMVNPEWSKDGYKWYEHVAAVFRMVGVDAIIGMAVDQDIEDVTRNIIYVGPPDFGLDDEYLSNLTSSEENVEVIDAYRTYIISAAKLLNPSLDEAVLASDAEEIIQFESALTQEPLVANETNKFQTLDPWYNELMNLVERQVTKEPKKVSMTVSNVQKITANEYFRWTEFLNMVFKEFSEVTDDTEIQVRNDHYFKYILKLVNETDARIVANYIGWMVVKKFGPHAAKAFRDSAFLLEKAIHGTEEPDELEETCLEAVIEVMGFAVGRLYVDKHIPQEAQNDVVALIDDIRSAYEINLNHNSWMDPETKSKALEKLRAMVALIGYPSWIKNDTRLGDYYSEFQDIKKDEYLISFVKASAALKAKTELELWNQPTQRTRWSSYPSEVNAFYDPYLNAMSFPAAIFNSPIYKYGRSPALNYAGIGSFAAHEISHGFDNNGHLRDKEGKRVNWWSQETAAKFGEKAECFKKQYSSFVEPMTNTSINGELTIGDNIADNGGVRNSFMAYKLKVLQAQENEVIPNLKLPGLSATPEQLFFIALATMECTHHSKDSMEEALKDEHAPAEYRVLVPFSNSKAFAEAFNCPLGSRMNPEAKCHLW